MKHVVTAAALLLPMLACGAPAPSPQTQAKPPFEAPSTDQINAMVGELNKALAARPDIDQLDERGLHAATLEELEKLMGQRPTEGVGFASREELDAAIKANQPSQ